LSSIVSDTEESLSVAQLGSKNKCRDK
jgi:hypothetical protein